jgi:site-specific DNA recombinase
LSIILAVFTMRLRRTAILKAAIYARVSTEEQTERATIQTQLTACRAYAERQGWEVVEEVKDDGVSGAIPFAERPGGRQLIELATTHTVERVVMLSVDRLARSIHDVKAHNDLHKLLAPAEKKRRRSTAYDEAWTGNGETYVHYVTQSFDTTGAGKMMFNTFLNYAEYERYVIRERTMAGRQRRIREGRYQAPTTPYGYTYDKKTGQLEPHPEQAEAVRKIFAWAAEGFGSKEIANRLDREGIESPHGNRRKIEGLGWNWGTIAKMLKEPRYIGKATYGGQPMSCPALVDEDLFDIVQQGLKQRKKDSKRNTKEQYLLQHLIWCRRCGSRYGSLTRKSSGKRLYACHQRRVYGERVGHEDIRWWYPAEEFEFIVWNTLLDFLRHPSTSVDTAHRTTGEEAETVRLLENQLRSINETVDSTLKAHGNKLITDADKDRNLIRLAQERREVEANLSDAQAVLDGASRIEDWMEDLRKRGNLGEVMAAAYEEITDFDEKQETLRTYVERIWVEDNGSLTFEGPGKYPFLELGSMWSDLHIKMPSR